MSGKAERLEREWDVLLVGGPSGCGKSSFSYPFARRFDLALTEADDLFITAERLTSPEAQPDRVMQELTKFELLSEAWGGDTLFVNTSATKGTGVKELLEAGVEINLFGNLGDADKLLDHQFVGRVPSGDNQARQMNLVPHAQGGDGFFADGNGKLV